MTYESVEGLHVSSDDAVLRIVLDRPERRNALTDDMLYALVDVFEQAGRDEAIRVICLTGSGDDFCSGFDLAGRRDLEKPNRVGATQRRLPGHAHRLVPVLLSVQLPMVALVRGRAAGLGLHLALGSDFALVAEDARLWEPFVTRGFTPDSGGSWLLPRLVGVARAKELLLLGRELSGTEAAEWGLVHRAVPGDELDTAGEALVQELAASATVALGLTKALVHDGLASTLHEHLSREALAIELSSRSADFKEGMAALTEKRAARFEGR